jgi:hypothetical protein
MDLNFGFTENLVIFRRHSGLFLLKREQEFAAADTAASDVPPRRTNSRGRLPSRRSLPVS